MDPNEALRALRAACDKLDSDEEFHDATDVLYEHFRALDEWLSRGGFLPEAWSSAEDRLPEHLIAVPKDSCEAEHPISHLQCWGSYGHEKAGEDHYVGDDRWSEAD